MLSDDLLAIRKAMVEKGIPPEIMAQIHFPEQQEDRPAAVFALIE